MEKIIAKCNEGDAHAEVIIQYNEDGKITKIIGQSFGNTWCGFGEGETDYTLEYGFDDYVEIPVTGEHYLVEGKLPEGFLKVWLYQ